jgi:pimeloyl-ACP methyl ester carboxylesterase
MGSVDHAPVEPGQAYEVVLPWGHVLRGVRWGSGDARVLFLHEPAAEKDLDDWGDLPLRLATMLDASSVVLDLPGHGLSDDPWEPERLSEIVTALVGESTTEQPLLIVAARESATAALAAAADHAVAAVATLSPSPGNPESTLPRSPATAKLFFAGAQDGKSLADSRKLASTLGGWTVVTSIPTNARGTDMLPTEWGARLREHIIAFARDVLFRQQAPRPLRQSLLPDR